MRRGVRDRGRPFGQIRSGRSSEPTLAACFSRWGLTLRRLHLTPVVGACVVALAVAASAGAYAAVTGSPKAIVACVGHKGGGLYVAHTCAHGDRVLTWNVTGAQGPAGKDGAAGAAGPKGDTGAAGSPGPFPGVLPAGITLRGNWASGSSAGGTAFGSISFGFAFASAPAFHYVPGPASVPAGCMGGTSANPTAQPGNLCLYSNGFPLNTSGPKVTGAANVWGTLFTMSSTSNAAFADGGTWAATSP